MRKLAIGLVIALALCTGCHAKDTTSPRPTVSTSDLDGVDGTLNSVERDLNDNG